LHLHLRKKRSQTNTRPTGECSALMMHNIEPYFTTELAATLIIISAIALIEKIADNHILEAHKPSNPMKFHSRLTGTRKSQPVTASQIPLDGTSTIQRVYIYCLPREFRRSHLKGCNIHH
jgi:hypothetical protein